jgi:diguanylate cyclase (GGDEF)-like protein
MARVGDDETTRILLATAEGEHLCAQLTAEDPRGFTCASAGRLADALERLRAERWDVVLLDPALPDSEGPADVGHLREVGPDIAVLVLTEGEDDRRTLAYLQAGAQDCLPRSKLASASLARAIRYALERMRAEKRLAHLASYDSLTGLVNRTTLVHRLNRAVARARRASKQVAVLFIDLDGFKPINDAFGHAVGDELLKLVATRLGTAVRATDTVARLGGDEFAIILEGIVDARDVARVAGKILDAINAPSTISGRETSISASIGIALFPSSGWEVSALLRHADAAMYRAKQNGAGLYQFFTQEMTAEAAERLTMERSLRRAVERDELVLYYQPEVDPVTGQVLGVEALVRWRHPDMGMVMPDRFLPLAEQSGLIKPIGEWVLRTACAQFVAWHRQELAPGRIAVNLSARELLRRDPSDTVFQVLKQSGLDPGSLELELAEGTLGTQAEAEMVNLSTLIAMGVRLAIDDFGTGYSSLSYLKRFPVDTLKIDGSFVRNLEVEPWDTAIVTAIIGLAHNLGLKVVAEGVETARQLAFLRAQGCDAVQGYFICPPLPADAFAAWLKGREPGGYAEGIDADKRRAGTESLAAV